MSRFRPYRLGPRAGGPLSSLARALLALAALVPIAALSACGDGSDAQDAPPRYATLPPANVSSAPVAGAAVEDEGARDASGDEPDDEGEGAAAEASAGPARLPADGNAAIIQLARIEPSPWEPAIKAQMVPHFSLQASGVGRFSTDSGPSEDGWYQTAITPHDAERFLQRLVDDVGVLELAAARGEEPVRFETPPDGETPLCPGSDQPAATGVVYVKTADREGSLVFSQCELIDPTGPEADQLIELQQVLSLVQLWKRGVDTDLPPETITATQTLLGWWSDLRQPYTPASVVAFGTRARGDIPADALRVAWPLSSALTETFDADFGATPVEARFEPPDSVALIRGARGAFGTTLGPRFWGPLWEDGSGEDFLIGLRPSVPGGNRVVIDYEFVPPPDEFDAQP